MQSTGLCPALSVKDYAGKSLINDAGQENNLLAKDFQNKTSKNYIFQDHRGLFQIMLFAWMS